MDDLIRVLAAELAARSDVISVALVGSAARGGADAYSDLDFHVIVPDIRPPDRVFYRGGRLVSVSFIDQAHAGRTLTEPNAALWGVLAARQARIFHDPHGWYTAYQARAVAFRWARVGSAASLLIGQRLAETVEEAHKIVGGRVGSQIVRALYAAQGVLWAMAEVSALANGSLIESENRYWSTVRAGEPDPHWRDLFWQALGMAPTPPEQRALAAARLYARSVQLYGGHLRPEHAEVARPAARLVETVLGR